MPNVCMLIHQGWLNQDTNFVVNTSSNKLFRSTLGNTSLVPFFYKFMDWAAGENKTQEIFPQHRMVNSYYTT